MPTVPISVYVTGAGVRVQMFRSSGQSDGKAPSVQRPSKHAMGHGRCKEQLPAPGNRSNERRYREKDLATTEEKKGRNGREERG
ncbi:hypothetical protein TNCV_2363431 [Trichonephila clavipes]|nr:hypothetical protein TNCV_2363431 [Trichonephila clavipes]